MTDSRTAETFVEVPVAITPTSRTAETFVEIPVAITPSSRTAETFVEIVISRYTPRTYAVDADLIAFKQTKIYTIDALLDTPGIKKTYLVDSLLKVTFPHVVYGLDAVIRGSRIRTTAIDAVIFLDPLKLSELYIEVIHSNNGNDRSCAIPGWWNCLYPYRRRIKVQGPRLGVIEDNPVSFVISNQKILDRGKVRADLADVEVVFRPEDFEFDPWTVLPRAARLENDNLYVDFPLSVNLSDGQIAEGEYFVYYGNLLLLGGAPTRKTYVPADWPVSVSPDSEVTYTHPGTGWTISSTKATSSIRHEQAAFDFESTKVRLRSDINRFSGIIEVQVDSGDWQEIDLYSSAALDNQVVFSIDDLSPSLHTIRVRCTGKNNPAAQAKEVNIRGFDYKKLVGAVDIHEEIIRLRWTTSHGGFSV